MKKAFKLLVILGVVAVVGGLIGFQQLLWADYSLKSSHKTVSEVFNGTVSVVGNSNTIRVKPGSEVECITLAGNDNTVRIDPGATVHKIRGAGSGNIIEAPESADIDLSLLKGGHNQRQIQRSTTLDGL